MVAALAPGRRPTIDWHVMMAKTRLAMAIGVVLLVGALCLPPRGAFAQTDQCPEPNEEPPTACPLADGAKVHAFMDRSGDVDVYRFDTGSAVRAQLDLTELPADYDMYLTDADNRVIGRSVREGVEAERLRLIVLAGTYYLFVLTNPSREPDPTRPYLLSVVFSGTDGAELPPAPRPVDGSDGATVVQYAGRWVSIEIRDERVHFAARAYPGEGGTEPISVVNFRFRRPDGRWDTGCHADTPDGDLYTCSMTINRAPEGEIKLGFDILDPRSDVTESPDGFRFLSVDR